MAAGPGLGAGAAPVGWVALSGHTRPVSDGSLYPAISRLVGAGLLERRAEPGASAAQRQVLSLTGAGRTELLRRLREPADHDITDSTRYFTILAFLSLLPDVADQHAVLARRLRFLEQPAGFFYDGDRPVRARDMDDPYRRGMLVIAGATSRAERAWLRETLAGGGADPRDAASRGADPRGADPAGSHSP
ncbi:PadR family transcriptional regulator [Nonomuraea sp. NPDC050783]|uniref:PadR family transcriptional regulator n=1 Tax=Nonomuraea sp. NPDC050783 TaxID=3154634 RepID=UPI003466698C